MTELTKDEVDELAREFVAALSAEDDGTTALSVDSAGEDMSGADSPPEGDDPSVLAPGTVLVDDLSLLYAQPAPEPAEKDDEADARRLPDKVMVTNGWSRLRAVVVGRLDNDVLPAWYPSFTDPDGNEVAGPETAGRTKRQFNREMFDLAVEQTEALCVLLEREGVRVFRPPLVSPADAQAPPVGLTAEWPREVFSIFSAGKGTSSTSKLVVNQPRASHRNKDHQALEPFFAALERAGKVQILRPPPCDWQRRDDNLEADERPFLEGGDVFSLGSAGVLVTMSYMATSPTGYRWLADTLAPDGIEVWPAYTTEIYEHGDYMFRSVREGLCIAHLNGFRDGLLPSPCTDWDVVALTQQEANEGFAANGLVLRENVLLMPAGNRRVTRSLKRKGVDVIEIPFDGPMYWQGGIDCATQELWRED